MKHVFITGVAGFLGSHLARRMNDLGWQVSGNDNLSGSDIGNVPKCVRSHNLDCCDLDSMKSAMEGVDLLFHAAATAHEGLSVFCPTYINQKQLRCLCFNFYSSHFIWSEKNRVLFIHGTLRRSSNAISQKKWIQNPLIHMESRKWLLKKLLKY